MQPLRINRQAHRRMQQRGIGPDEVETVLRQPEWVEESQGIAEEVTLDLVDPAGRIVGLEVLDALEALGLGNLVKVSIEELPLDRLSCGA